MSILSLPDELLLYIISADTLALTLVSKRFYNLLPPLGPRLTYPQYIKAMDTEDAWVIYRSKNSRAWDYLHDSYSHRLPYAHGPLYQCKGHVHGTKGPWSINKYYPKDGYSLSKGYLYPYSYTEENTQEWACSSPTNLEKRACIEKDMHQRDTLPHSSLSWHIENVKYTYIKSVCYKYPGLLHRTIKAGKYAKSLDNSCVLACMFLYAYGYITPYEVMYSKNPYKECILGFMSADFPNEVRDYILDVQYPGDRMDIVKYALLVRSPMVDMFNPEEYKMWDIYPPKLV